MGTQIVRSFILNTNMQFILQLDNYYGRNQHKLTILYFMCIPHFFRVLHHALGRSAEIVIDFCSREKKIAVTVLTLDKYTCWQIIAAGNTITKQDACRDLHLLHSVRKLDCQGACFAQQKYRNQFSQFFVPVRIPRTDPPLYYVACTVYREWASSHP